MWVGGGEHAFLRCPPREVDRVENGGTRFRRLMAAECEKKAITFASFAPGERGEAAFRDIFRPVSKMPTRCDLMVNLRC